MICFDIDSIRFNFRVAAVIMHDGKVLLQTTEQDPFWVLPGGRVEGGESSQSAIEREIKEELKVDAVIERLLWCYEGFFTYNGLRHHEIGFYYLAHLPQGHPIYRETGNFRGYEENYTLWERWFDLNTIAELDLYPIWLRERLQHLPAHPEHIVLDEDSLGI